jgi:hypothetical protein
MRSGRGWLLASGATAMLACAGGESPVAPDRAPAAAAAQVCPDREPLRQVYYGDLHVHTVRSFDAYLYDTRATPDDAYRFARGAPLGIAPLDAEGRPTRSLRLERPLDFTAVTDHAELLAENALCTLPGSAAYETEPCRTYRGSPDDDPAGRLLRRSRAFTSGSEWRYNPEVCGEQGGQCLEAGNRVWTEIRQAADRAYDRCRFTSLVGYEFSATPGLSNLHRNVIFRSRSVPARLLSASDTQDPRDLWRWLREDCIDAGIGCDALAIPHNSNKSNGRMFALEYGDAPEVEQAALRQQLEPLVEIMQHKGDSECRNGVSGVVGAADELCDFEKLRLPEAQDCGEGVGEGGMFGSGCVSRRDFVRYALVEGLREGERIGVNPLKLGIIASTDTHNASPGAVAERGFVGHLASIDALPESRQRGQSPGGLAAVWAEENTREAIFDALRRRETFGTSGPRMSVRLFGGWDYAPDLCRSPDLVARGYADGVPMGGDLPRASTSTGAPSFVAWAQRDPGTQQRPGAPLERIQIVKGWVEPDGLHEMVYDVAGAAAADTAADPETCQPLASGAAALCSVWRDPDFDPARPAVYYARVLQVPTCRHAEHTCQALPVADRPARCADAGRVRRVRERAWTSPIWYEPDAGR